MGKAAQPLDGDPGITVPPGLTFSSRLPAHLLPPSPHSQKFQRTFSSFSRARRGKLNYLLCSVLHHHNDIKPMS